MATQAAVVHYALEPLAVELREVPVPEIGDGEALLAVGAVSVCGSDVHQAHNTHSWPVNVPVVLGHEFGGTIARLGRGTTGFREGTASSARRPRRFAAGACSAAPAATTCVWSARDLDMGSMARWRSGFGSPRVACTASRTRSRSTSPVSPSLTPLPIRQCASTPRSGPATRSSSSAPDPSVCFAHAWRRSRVPIR